MTPPELAASLFGEPAAGAELPQCLRCEGLAPKDKLFCTRCWGLIQKARAKGKTWREA